MANHQETVISAICAQLEAELASGGTYALPPDPDGVLRLVFMPEQWVPDPTFTTVYYLWPETETAKLGPESCQISHQLGLVVRACHRLAVASENPNEQNPVRWQAAAELAADVRQAVFSDFTFGGTARRVVDNTIVTEFHVWEPSTAMVDVRFVIEYTTARPGR